MIQHTLTLKMTTPQFVETSVTANNNSPIQDYVHPDDQAQPTYEMTPGFKPFTTDIFYWANKVHLFTACDGRELRRLWCCLIHEMFFFSARCIKNQRSRYKSDSFALSSISYPEPSGFLVSGVTPKKTLGTSTLDRRNPKNWYSVFTWRHGGHIGVPKQWNGYHVGVPNQSCGNWTLFSCKRFLSFQ